MKFNLKKFRKISSDEKSTVLEHPHGHKITIAHQLLSPKLKDDLDSLPMYKDEEAESLAKGGRVKGYDDGGEVDDQGGTPININIGSGPQMSTEKPFQIAQNDQPAPESPPDPNKKYQDRYNQIYEAEKKFNPGQPDTMDQEIALSAAEKLKNVDTNVAKSASDQIQNQDLKTVALNQRRAALGLEPLPVSSQNLAMNGPGPGPNVPGDSGNQPQPTQGGAPQDMFSQFPGYKEQLAGVSGEAKAMGEQGQAQAKVYDAYSEGLKALQGHSEQESQFWQNELHSLYNDQKNGHINPNAYLENMGAGKKIATAIGLLLGGMGSGITGGQNPALAFLNNQIERDVQAQTKNLQQKNNLMNYAMDATKNSVHAMEASRLMRATIMAADIDKIAAQSQNPLWQARAQQLKGQIMGQYSGKFMPLMMSMAWDKMNPSQGPSAPEAVRMLGQVGIMPKEQVSKAYEEIGSLEEIDKAKQEALDTFDHLRGMTLNGALSPNLRQAMIEPLAGRIERVSEGRYNHDAAKVIAEGLLPKSTEFFGKELDQKRQNTEAFFEGMKKSPILDAFRIKKPVYGKYNEQGQKKKLGPPVAMK